MGDDILLNPHLHPLVAPPTAHTAVDRPTAALDPVTAVQLTSVTSKDTDLSNHAFPLP